MRDRRQMVSGQGSTMEGDIIVRNRTVGSQEVHDAPHADPDRLWPGGVVEYQFYHTFPVKNRKIVLEAMAYITSKVPCIKFKPKVELAKDFVTIYDGADSCSSELGRVGGSQELNLNK